MKNTIRILSAVLVLSMLLTGCSLWKPVVSSTPDVAATYGDGQTIATGEYLAYLYNAINDTMSTMYQAGKDATTEKYTLGDKKDLTFDEYIPLLVEQNIKKQIVLDKLIKDNGIKFETEEDFKSFTGLHDTYHSLEEARKDYEPGWILSLGISDASYTAVEDKLVLNEDTAFFGLYGKGGAEEIEDKVLREYYGKNYISYKVIAISLDLTDEEKAAAALTSEESKGLTDKEKKEAEEKKLKEAEAKKLKESKEKLEGYLKIVKKENFEKAMDQYRKDLLKEQEEEAEANKTPTEEEEFEPSTDKDNRVNAHRDDEEDSLEKELDKMKNGEVKLIEKLVYAEAPYAVVLQKLDINEPKTVFDDFYEAILKNVQNEAFQKMLDKMIQDVKIEFNQEVLDTCTVAQMMEDMEKASAQ
ncbi:MAG: hypothetical protein E7527_01605 [Ruminococcaceae bacterium]|nr:hypothetical protein [Oscillospiraceae bacterium]